jgi:hypothetical protein
MRLGKIKMTFEYTVDLDNERMVDYAKDAILEDIGSFYLESDNIDALEVVEDKDAKEGDIPSFLLEENE